MPGTHHLKPWAPPISLCLEKHPIFTCSHGLFLSYWQLLYWPLQRWGCFCLFFGTVNISVFTAVYFDTEIFHRWMEIQLAAFVSLAIRTTDTVQGLFWLLSGWSLSLAAISWYEVREIFSFCLTVAHGIKRWFYPCGFIQDLFSRGYDIVFH